jgi:hypothetical protein
MVKHEKKGYDKIISLKKTDIEIDEYVEKSKFLKDVLSIAATSRNSMVQSPSKIGHFAKKIFGNERKPGVSPVREMIKGQNDSLLFAEYMKNFSSYQSIMETPQQRQDRDRKMIYDQSRVENQKQSGNLIVSSNTVDFLSPVNSN